MFLKKSAAFALTTSAAFSPQLCQAEITPVVMVSESSMPQRVPDDFFNIAMEKPEDVVESNSKPEPLGALKIYKELKDDFGVSHTEMSKWLGVTRRSLYNWKYDPEKAKKNGPRIENRLVALSLLKNEMEPEHRPLLFKVAFSPIYGDPKFGGDILDGAESNQLLSWYDSLFSKFEAYRSTLSSNEKIG
ncbi:hypothetical protein [Gilvimarinus sp. 1_MG-2023]|uniref:hypothetical protein n=1 Tax=Gilvimarinus sp. 1_MG-2023 TaxID=3062638 RepID=UPI0026E11F8F|nr:hypothetical protein [Gilvimarinus sp. 1_MG-2023]MDO6747832.1 hypothetical protein [Gilvimarinus sp. 1_MG-2023]